MAEFKPKLQWAADITVWHEPSFGHRVTLTTQKQGHSPEQAFTTTWKGLGIPWVVLTDIQSMVPAVVTEYLTWRYGVADELPSQWQGDPEPF